ncbi:MAG: CPBP family intramembrane metalloprotease [Rhodothermales bacterium]|nr:CPBP family intramembrane metalloprotease [Rhodothermales bacterium]
MEQPSLHTAAPTEPALPGDSVPDTYFSLTRTRTYGFLSALPLLILYEVMIVLANEGAYQQIRVGAEIWVKEAFALIGQTGVFIMGIAVVLVGSVILFSDRKRGISIRPAYFGGIVVESVVYALVVAIVVSSTVGFIFAGLAPEIAMAQSAGPGGSMFMNIALSIGAGIYEELIFRVILVGGMAFLLKSVGIEKVASYIFAAIVGAAIFSAVHYIGSLGDDFTLPSFTFRFLFGLALNGIFLVRGFGVAAWTHAIYDILIVTGAFS